VIQQVLVPRRIAHLANKPLLAVEMVAPLSAAEPVSLEEEAAFNKWFVILKIKCFFPSCLFTGSSRRHLKRSD
jgi:hypothetical protein